MKLTNPETIQDSEKDFIDSINAELDWEAIEKMLLEKHNFTLQEEIEYKDGDLMVYNDQIAYRFDFEIKVPLSVIFNRQGECLEISTMRADFDEDVHDREKLGPNEDAAAESETTAPAQQEKVARMASNIADMISEINQGDDQ